MMSEENVQIVRDLMEAFRRRDHKRAFDLLRPRDRMGLHGNRRVDPDIAGVYRGHEGVWALATLVVLPTGIAEPRY